VASALSEKRQKTAKQRNGGKKNEIKRVKSKFKKKQGRWGEYTVAELSEKAIAGDKKKKFHGVWS